MSIHSQDKLSVSDVIDSRKVSFRQWIYFLLIFFLLVSEGMDGTIVSHVFPSLISEWGVAVGGGISFVVSGGFIIMGLGALTAGKISDRWGRKTTLIGAGLIMSAATYLGSTSVDFTWFTIWRFLACLGIGAVLPTAFALLADLVPKKSRGGMVAASYAGIGLGSAVGAVLAGLIIPTDGWRGLLLAGGIVPLVIVLALWIIVPESPGFFAAKQQESKAQKAFRKLMPSVDVNHILWTVDLPQKGQRRSTAGLLSKGFKARTVLLWVFSFTSLGMLMVFNQYLPTLLQLPSPGLDTVQSSSIVAIQGLGGVFGILIFGVVLARWSYYKAIGLYLFIAALMLTGVALLADSGYITLLLSLTATALFMPAATGPTRNTIAIEIYPNNMRATGIGAAELSARLGSASQGALGGVFIGLGLTLSGFFLALLVPLSILAATLTGLKLLPLQKESEAIEKKPDPVDVQAP